MRKVPVSAERLYEVLIGSDYQRDLADLVSNRQRVAIIYSGEMQSFIPDFSFGDSEIFYFPIPDGEAGKNSKPLLQVWDWLGAAGFTRSDLIVGLGGGAVTDFAGFVASTWLRGIDWVAIPTTIAGGVDASVGGKTGINSDYGKNLIGAFHSPISVLIDPTWFASLSDRDFAAGMAEVVKCGFISDPKILQLLANSSITKLRADGDLVEELIFRAISVKAAVVSEDFKESFAREALNYGHTFGHALEKLSKFELRHGECVSVGMAYIAELSLELGVIDQELRDLHFSVLTSLDLPTSIPENLKGVEFPEYLATMKIDKKSRGNSIRFVILDGIGQTQRLENPQVDVLQRAYEKISQ